MHPQPITQTALSRTHHKTGHLPSRRPREVGTEIPPARLQCQHGDFFDRRRRCLRLLYPSGPASPAVPAGLEDQPMVERWEMESDELGLVFAQPASHEMGKEEDSKSCR